MKLETITADAPGTIEELRQEDRADRERGCRPASLDTGAQEGVCKDRVCEAARHISLQQGHRGMPPASTAL